MKFFTELSIPYMCTGAFHLDAMATELDKLSTFNPVFDFDTILPQCTGSAQLPEPNLPHKIFPGLRLTIGSIRRSNLSDHECPICQESLEGMRTLTHTACKRSFHTNCLEMWLHNNTTCPIDREILSYSPNSSIICSYSRCQLMVIRNYVSKDRYRLGLHARYQEFLSVPPIEDVLQSNNGELYYPRTHSYIPSDITEKICWLASVIQLKCGRAMITDGALSVVVMGVGAQKPLFPIWALLINILIPHQYHVEARDLLLRWLRVSYKTMQLNSPQSVPVFRRVSTYQDFKVPITLNEWRRDVAPVQDELRHPSQLNHEAALTHLQELQRRYEQIAQQHLIDNVERSRDDYLRAVREHDRLLESQMALNNEMQDIGDFRRSQISSETPNHDIQVAARAAHTKLSTVWSMYEPRLIYLTHHMEAAQRQWRDAEHALQAHA